MRSAEPEVGDPFASSGLKVSVPVAVERGEIVQPLMPVSKVEFGIRLTGAASPVTVTGTLPLTALSGGEESFVSTAAHAPAAPVAKKRFPGE